MSKHIPIVPLTSTRALDKMLRVQSKVIAMLVDHQIKINAPPQPGIDAIKDLTRQSLKVNWAIAAARVKVSRIE